MESKRKWYKWTYLQNRNRGTDVENKPEGKLGLGGINWEIGIRTYIILPIKSGFLGSSTGKESACNAGDPSWIPGFRSSPKERVRLPTPVFLGFPGDSDGKEYIYNAGYLGLIPGLGRSPGRRHGNPLQYSCLENPMDRGAWLATVHGVTKSQTWLNN